MKISVQNLYWHPRNLKNLIKTNNILVCGGSYNRELDNFIMITTLCFKFGNRIAPRPALIGILKTREL